MADGKQALTATAAEILAANTSRVGIVMYNEGANTAYVSFEGTAVKNEGIVIPASQGVILEAQKHGAATIKKAISGVCNTAETATIAYHELEA